MNITKDEARILSHALSDAKYQIVDILHKEADRKLLISALDELERRLDLFFKDKRRTGRRSQDDFADCLKRFANDYSYKQSLKEKAE